MVQQVKPLLGVPAFLIRVPGKEVISTLDQILPATHIRNPYEVLGPWFQLGPALVVVSLWEINLWMKDTFFFLS